MFDQAYKDGTMEFEETPTVKEIQEPQYLCSDLLSTISHMAYLLILQVQQISRF